MAELDRLIVRIEADTGPLRRELARMERDSARAAGRTAEGFDGLDESLNGVTDSAAGLRTALADIEAPAPAAGFLGGAAGETDALSAAAERLGSTFGAAFQDAVAAGNGLRDVLHGLLRDLGRLGVRSFVTKPLAAALGGFARSGSFGDLFGAFGFGDSPLGRLVGGGAAAGITVPRIAGASGGIVLGAGGPRQDAVPALLSAGEFVVNAGAARAHRGLLEAINGGAVARFADGGMVPGSSPGLTRGPAGGSRRAAPAAGRPAEAGETVNITVNVPAGTRDPNAFGWSAGQAAALAFRQGLGAHRRKN